MDETLQWWPLVVVVIDGYDPADAPLVLSLMADLDDETCAALWACHGFAAEQDARARRN